MNQPRKKTKRAPSSRPVARVREGTGHPKMMELARNRQGELYFRRFAGSFVTWHFYPSGELMLREEEIEVGMEIPGYLYDELLIGDHIYTDRGGSQAVELESEQTTNDGKAKQFLDHSIRGTPVAGSSWTERLAHVFEQSEDVGFWVRHFGPIIGPKLDSAAGCLILLFIFIAIIMVSTR